VALSVREECYTEKGRLRKRCPDIITVSSFRWPRLRQVDVVSLVSIDGGAGVDQWAVACVGNVVKRQTLLLCIQSVPRWFSVFICHIIRRGLFDPIAE
jgi:hypothetical protein